MRQRMPGLAPRMVMWLDLFRVQEGCDWEEGFLATVSQHTRRNVRVGLRSELTCSEAEDPEEIRAAFEVIEANGRSQGYATRNWQEFGQPLIEQVHRGQAVILAVRHHGRLVGVHYAVLAGRRWSYLMGGTERTDENLRVGHFTLWSAIRNARQRGLLGFNLDSAGTSGVNRFKMGFHPQTVELIPPQELVLQPLRYQACAKLLPAVQRHRRMLATMTQHLGFFRNRD